MMEVINRVQPGKRNSAILGALLLALVMLLSACGDTPTATPTTAPTATAATDSGSSDVTEVKATLREWGLDIDKAEVPAGKVRFVVTNTGMMQHNFTIRVDGGDKIDGTPNFGGATPQTLEVDLKAGAYILYCALPGHEQRGQKATLTVK